MLNRSYQAWPPPPLPEDPINFPTAQPSSFLLKNPQRNNWKSKNSKNPNEIRRNDPLGIGNVYKFSYPHDSRRSYRKKKFNNRFAPFAPRNTTSFLIRAKKSGGIASLVSPCPVTPAVLPTPMFSPSREVLVDMAKEEWGVDGYGSMNGLIRLRSLGMEEEEGGGVGGTTSDSDVERVEVERRLDHDLSRFEMVYPSGGAGGSGGGGCGLETRMDEQDSNLARLEEENLILKERLFFMETGLEDMRRRILCLERDSHGEVSENASENEGGGDVSSER